MHQLPPLTYYVLNAVAVVAIAAGIYLIFTGLPAEPTMAERMAYSNALLAEAETLAAGREPASRAVAPGRPADILSITLGVQAILAGVLFAGFGTIIDLLHRISRR